jgi:MraZ protein
LSFTGEFRHTIDAKGRLIVPARLRPELTGDKAVLAIYMNGCIAMWSGEGWDDLEQRILAEGRSNADARAVVRGIAASAHQDEVDRQGRITIPPNLRHYAGIDKDVVVIGALDHAEIWNPERWEQEQAKVEEGGLDELAQRLNF